MPRISTVEAELGVTLSPSNVAIVNNQPANEIPDVPFVREHPLTETNKET